MHVGARLGPVALSIGASVSAYWIPSELDELYGSARWGYTVFQRLGF